MVENNFCPTYYQIPLSYSTTPATTMVLLKRCQRKVHASLARSSENVTWSTTSKHIHITTFSGALLRTIPNTIKAIFMLFVSTSVLDIIITESNRYAQQCLGESYSQWTPMTLEELEAYMEFMVLMGLVKLPSVYDYWRKDEVFHAAVEILK